MKIRTGFVSNSSSSSFVCDICGIADTLYTGNLSEIDMCECKWGHILCIGHCELIAFSEDDGFEGIISKENCPICSFKQLGMTDELNYYRKLMGVDQVFEEIKLRFSTYDEFNQFLYKR